MIKIAICDDEKKELETVYALLTDAAQDLGIVCRCSLFESGEKLLDEIENGHTVYDIALLDIYMKELSGIRAAEQLAGLCPETAVVFITTSQEHAVDAFTLEALHYLVKPVDAGQLRTVLERYLKKTARKKPWKSGSAEIMSDFPRSPSSIWKARATARTSTRPAACFIPACPQACWSRSWERIF